MNNRRLICSGSWLLRRRFCVAVCAEPAVPSFASARRSSTAAAAVSKSGVVKESLYGRLAFLGTKGGTMAEALNQLVTEGRSLNKAQLLHCVRVFRRFHRPWHALEIIEWMESRKMRFSSSDHAIRVDLIAKVKGAETAENYFNSLSPFAKNNHLTYGALLNCYCIQLMEERALAHFHKMDDLNFLTNCLPFDNLMTLHMRLGQPDKVPFLFEEMKHRGISPSDYTYSILMQSFANSEYIMGVEELVKEMESDNEEKITWKVYANLAAIYIKAGLYDKAEMALKKLEEKMNSNHREPYHFLLSLYAGISSLPQVNRVWDSLRKTFPRVNNTSYIFMLNALMKLEDVDGVKKHFKEWELLCSYYDIRLPNIAISCYLEHDMCEEAASVLNNALKRSTGRLTSVREKFMIYSLKKRQVNVALKHLEEAVTSKKDSWRWNEELVNAFCDYFQEEKDVEGAEELCRVLKKSGSLDSNAYILLLKTYVAAGKSLTGMRERLKEDGIEIDEELENLKMTLLD